MDDKPYTYGPVEPKELMFALSVGHAAATLKMPVENPELMGVNLRDEQSGQVMRISLTDRPMNRAMLALREQFKGDKFVNIGMRRWALARIMEHKAVQEWIRKGPDGFMEVADSLVYAAARGSLSKRFRFNVREIVRLAREYEKLQESEESN